MRQEERSMQPQAGRQARGRPKAGELGSRGRRCLRSSALALMTAGPR